MSKAFRNPVLQNCQHVLRGPRQLEIGTLDVNGREESLLVPRITSAIRYLISLAPNLEIITLREIELHCRVSSNKPSLSDVLPNCYMRNLRKVDIDEYDISERALTVFFERQSSTLAEVRSSFMPQLLIQIA